MRMQPLPLSRQRRDGRPILIGDEQMALEALSLGGGETRLSEAWLQELLFNHPEALPMHELEPGFADLVAVCRELPTAHGPVDNLFMTVEGDIVIVEAKLWRNPQARREVISQALDYASCLFEMSYESFEAAALRGSYGGLPKPASLYGLFGDRPDALAEEAFIDAVSNNLARGRIVVLVVGDGIRAETERLMDALQLHAGFHFTFALIEMSLFRLGATGQLLAVPRTLTRTTMIERGIVRIEGGGAKVSAAAPTIAITSGREGPSAPELGSITAEQFFEDIAKRDPRAPGAIKALLASLEPLGVYPDFRRALNIKWEPPEGKPVNLGSIYRTGQIWTDQINWSVPHAISHRYVEALADAWNMDVDKTSYQKDAWHVRINGSAPRIETVIDKLPAWGALITRFVVDFDKAMSEPDVLPPIG